MQYAGMSNADPSIQACAAGGYCVGCVRLSSSAAAVASATAALHRLLLDHLGCGVGGCVGGCVEVIEERVLRCKQRTTSTNTSDNNIPTIPPLLSPPPCTIPTTLYYPHHPLAKPPPHLNTVATTVASTRRNRRDTAAPTKSSSKGLNPERQHKVRSCVRGLLHAKRVYARAAVQRSRSWMAACVVMGR